MLRLLREFSVCAHLVPKDNVGFIKTHIRRYIWMRNKHTLKAYKRVFEIYSFHSRHFSCRRSKGSRQLNTFFRCSRHRGQNVKKGALVAVHLQIPSSGSRTFEMLRNIFQWKYTHSVVLTFVRRRPNVVDVVQTLKQRYVRTGMTVTEYYCCKMVFLFFGCSDSHAQILKRLFWTHTPFIFLSLDNLQTSSPFVGLLGLLESFT